jgi:hypothetical protein
MTLQEWIEGNHSFYHITQLSNIPSILREGLKNGNPRGICVIRSNHPDIIEYICQTMLFVSDEVDFAIIEIKPKNHNLTSNVISNDDVVEITNPLHNYIRKIPLHIEPSDIISTHTINPRGIAGLAIFEQRIRNLNIIAPLDTI